MSYRFITLSIKKILPKHQSRVNFEAIATAAWNQYDISLTKKSIPNIHSYAIIFSNFTYHKKVTTHLFSDINAQNHTVNDI